MSALDIFNYEGQQVRTVIIDGEPWFVAADVAAILELGNPRSSLALLDNDEKGVHTVDTLGGPQSMNTVNEPGLFGLILRSRKPEARAFKRWVTHDVLPTIRKTGRYGSDVGMLAALPSSQLLQLAAEAARRAEEAEEQNRALTPRAEAWDELASAEGDYSVADAANILKRAGVNTGPQRLFDTLGEIRWTYRGEGRRWRPYATALESGYLTERAMPPRMNSEGELVPTPPQVRVTARGLERLRVRLGSLNELERVS